MDFFEDPNFPLSAIVATQEFQEAREIRTRNRPRSHFTPARTPYRDQFQLEPSDYPRNQRARFMQSRRAENSDDATNEEITRCAPSSPPSYRYLLRAALRRQEQMAHVNFDMLMEDIYQARRNFRNIPIVLRRRSVPSEPQMRTEDAENMRTEDAENMRTEDAENTSTTEPTNSNQETSPNGENGTSNNQA